MKKNVKVLQINGFRGLFLALFVVCCLIAGFVVFPAFLTMHAWNFLSVKTGSLPALNFGEGLLLWAIIFLSAFIFNKKKFIVSFNAQQELSDEEVKEVLSKIKTQAIEHNVLLPKELNLDAEKQEESQENKLS